MEIPMAGGGGTEGVGALLRRFVDGESWCVLLRTNVKGANEMHANDVSEVAR